MEELQARHRKEQRDLQARVTQKKKQATKKTRKGVNEECARLEAELKTRQEDEILALNGDGSPKVQDSINDLVEEEAPNASKETGSEPLADVPDGSAMPAVNGEASESNDEPTRRKPNKAKARLARRAAEQKAMIAQAEEEAKAMPDQKTIERDAMQAELKRRGLVEKVVRADGHCLYASVADQMAQLDLDIDKEQKSNEEQPPKTAEQYKAVRQTAAQWIGAHPSDFEPFLEEPMESYLHKIRETGEWGGHLELNALANAYDVKINVLQGSGRVEVIEPAQGKADHALWLGYYHHGFGLGEHYNSLRKAG